MGQAFDYFGDSKDALRMLIPVMINEKNVAMRERRLEELARIEQEKLGMEREKLEETKKAKLQEWKLKGLSGMAEKFIAEGDHENLKKLAPAFQEFGIDLSQLIPTEKASKPPTSTAGLAWSLGGGDREATLKVWKEMHPDKPTADDRRLYPTDEGYLPRDMALGKKPLRAGSGDATEKLPPDVKASMDFIKKFAGGSQNPMLLMFASMMPNAPQMAADPKFQQALAGGVPEELRPVLDNNLKIVNNYFSKKAAAVTGVGAAPDAAAGGEMPQMPDAAQHKGRTIRDTESGKKFRSDGNQWIEIGAE